MPIGILGLQDIVLDISTKLKQKTFRANESDTNARGLSATIKNNGAIYDCTGVTLRFRYIDPITLQAHIFDFEPISASLGTFKIAFPSEMIRGNGGKTIKCTIVAEDSTSELAFENIYIFVNMSEVDSNGIEASNEYSTLRKALDDVQAVETELGNINPTTLTDAVTLANTLPTVESARVTSENARVISENNRVTAETTRTTAETNRNVYEDYNVSKAYKVNNKVTYLGSSYLCIHATTGDIAPTDVTYWLKIVSKGDQGTQGVQGIKGDKGDTGAKGDTGSQGIQGIKGDTGDKGEKGDTGLKGDIGETFTYTHMSVNDKRELISNATGQWNPEFETKYTALETEYATDLTGVKSQLAENAKKIKNIILLEDFGGKANDNTIDNSTALVSAINFLLSNGGGTIQLLDGIYKFNTAIAINIPFSCIKLQGVGIWNGTNGTKIDWTGSGYFLTLNQGGQYYEIKDLYLNCINNYGFLLNKGAQTHFKSRLKDIFIANALRSIDLMDFAYYFIENVIIGTGNPNTERGILIDSQGISEFLYMDKCSVDGYDSCNTDAVIVNNGRNIYMNDCDICNWGTGIGLLIETNSTRTIECISVRDLNMIRCDGGLQLIATNAPITQVLIDNPVITFRGLLSTEVGIKTSRSDVYVVRALRLTSLNFRKLGNTNPGNVVYLGWDSIGKSYVDINSNLTSGKCYIGAAAGQVTYHDVDASFFEKSFSFTGDGMTTAFICILTSSSPLRGNIPMIIANTSLAIAFKVVAGNALGGNLFAYITFATPPANGTAFNVYTVCGHKLLA